MILLEAFSKVITRWTGSTGAFGCALGVIVGLGAARPGVPLSDTWQLVINTGTTIVTFLMVFLIQRAQNKDSLAIHLKLNEIVAALTGASNRLVDVESLSEKELAQLHRFYSELATLCRQGSRPHGFTLGRGSAPAPLGQAWQDKSARVEYSHG